VNVANNIEDNEGSNLCTGTCIACQAGSCGNATNNTDPDSDCGAVQCDGDAVTPYYFGWNASFSCNYRQDEADGSCGASGSCLTAANYCGSNPEDGYSNVTCGCAEMQIGCTGTTQGSCAGLCSKGIIPVGSGTPFWTNATSNPITINLGSNDDTVVTFWVNATGDVGGVYEFYVYANITSNMSVNNWTDRFNVTIVGIGVGETNTNFTIWDGALYVPAEGAYIRFLCRMPSTQCTPFYQTNDNGIFQVCNNGTTAGTGVRMKLDKLCTNVTFYVDDDSTYSGSIGLTTSMQDIHGALGVDECQQFWMWSSYLLTVPSCNPWPIETVEVY
jgi:hypothetical protein